MNTAENDGALTSADSRTRRVLDDEGAESGNRITELLAPALQAQALPAQRESALRQRLQQRVGASAAKHRAMRTVRREDQVWQVLTKGVRACVLHDNGTIRSALVEFDAGSKVPSHRHFAHEECVVLSGQLTTGEITVGKHDYHLARSGSRHPSIGSEEGARIFLRGTSIGNGTLMMRELISAWLPRRGAAPTTVRADQGAWHDTGEGAQVKTLWVNEGAASMLVRLAPGGRLPGHRHLRDEECLAIEGEAFLGDILLRAGEYQMAPENTEHGEISSDVGALLFVHTTANLIGQN